MCNILLVSCSAEATTSPLRRATGDAIAALHELSRNCVIHERHLYPGAVPPLDPAAVDALKAPPSRRSLDQCRAAALSDILLKEVRSADVLILEAPMKDGSIPAELVLWSDHVGCAARAVGARGQMKIALLIADMGDGLECEGGVFAGALQRQLAPAGISEVALVEPNPNGYPLRPAPLMLIASRTLTALH